MVCTAVAKRERKMVKRVPKGTSDYQASWIVAEEEEDDEDEVGNGPRH